MYRPDNKGMRELGQSRVVGDACMEAARRGASWANSMDRRGSYRAERVTVPAGWSNEPRAGAMVSQTKPSGVGPRDRVLVRAVSVIEGK